MIAYADGGTDDHTNLRAINTYCNALKARADGHRS